MLQKTTPNENFKKIDQMLEDFAGDEVDDFETGYGNYEKSHKHYSADEDALMNIDDLY
ncbi:hypothetical protein [Methylophilus medardicus]|uniref:hypothetical protein n=1 Tax=Methylophilus medardicus TaxID=2588534 RepID=UPI00167A353C|nr:hypothetical protein [Methylophilus medardicus]